MSWYSYGMKKKSGKDISDINVLAKSIVDAATQGKNPTEDAIKAVMREMGRRGGLKGGKARAKILTADRRKEIAQKAARNRWTHTK
ncbi:MAG: hypothetical protein PHR77_02130 [Kiritimatiellae bacterium]|nr:hypothetical protein [Kiritimatiellia bacterium]